MYVERLAYCLTRVLPQKNNISVDPTRKSGRTRETYVVCLECGTEFQYDWQQMRVLKPLKVVVPASDQHDPVPLEADPQHSL